MKLLIEPKFNIFDLVTERTLETFTYKYITFNVSSRKNISKKYSGI